MLRFACLTFILLTACGTDTGDSQSGSGSTTADPATTGAPTTSSGTTAADTTSSGSATGTDDATTATPTTGEPATTADTTGGDATTGADDTTGGDATTGDLGSFDRFRLDRAAGPCPPDADCDGFIELLADGTLRVEKFGDVQDDVVEVQISQDDLDAATPVFADPDLFALLAQDDIPCMPPTDVFESMELDVAGDVVMNQTTACTQPPLAAAREMANALADEYAP